jgi:hypothetical protein
LCYPNSGPLQSHEIHILNLLGLRVKRCSGQDNRGLVRCQRRPTQRTRVRVELAHLDAAQVGGRITAVGGVEVELMRSVNASTFHHSQQSVPESVRYVGRGYLPIVGHRLKDLDEEVKLPDVAGSGKTPLHTRVGTLGPISGTWGSGLIPGDATGRAQRAASGRGVGIRDGDLEGRGDGPRAGGAGRRECGRQGGDRKILRLPRLERCSESGCEEKGRNKS